MNVAKMPQKSELRLAEIDVYIHEYISTQEPLIQNPTAAVVTYKGVDDGWLAWLTVL